MDNKMLIDADHPEETRVVVVRGNRVEEFDFEAENKKQLRGNIYLAKVTRVEPSLQAAFVDYGGNRHGFLAFSEIHPDYYQIPVADRQALLEEEAAAIQEDNSDDEDEVPVPKKGRRRRSRKNTSVAAEAGGEDKVVSDVIDGDEDASESVEAIAADDTDNAANSDETTPSEAEGDAEAVAAPDSDIAAETETVDEPVSEEGVEATSEEVLENDASQAEEPTEEVTASSDEESSDDNNDDDGESSETVEAEASSDDDDSNGDDEDEDDVESVGSEDAMEEVPERRSRPRAKQYKIQEVIKRRQIILVQVVKEERGNKGAALTTYLSLAGRYSVLMPNTDRGGGISRKITNQADRKRLRTIASDLDVAEGMGVILRTAGASRTKTEIRRDFEYLMRLWENVRDFTLKSSAPSLVYEEGSLLKRSIRDLYNKDIKQILVSGDTGYREAKDFMRMLMPSHAKNVQPYKEANPIFARYGVEAQLDAMFSPEVTLKSGGYIVINQTEALVSIDVNSGRSTRERSIEDTALSTNLEAAEEVARQLRLRDLAGLVVIDFIDMEEKRNNRAVERKLKECLKNDRARIQVGRISHFGLLEMSRQRIRTGVLESTMEICPTCQGVGHVRGPASVALHVLRAVEDYLIKGSKYNLIVRTKTNVALYVLNQKRAHLSELEDRFGLTITFEADETIMGDYCSIVRGDRAEAPKTPASVTPETVNIDEELARDAELDAAAEAAEQEQIANDQETEENDGRKRRRRRRRRRSDDNTDVEVSVQEDDEGGEVSAEEGGDDDEDAPRKKRRRRGRRGGRRDRNRNQDEVSASDENADSETSSDGSEDTDTSTDASVEVNVVTENETAESGENEAINDEDDTPVEEAVVAINGAGEPAVNGAEAPGQRIEEPAQVEEVEAGAETEDVAEPEVVEEEPKKPTRGGWWQRRSFF